MTSPTLFPARIVFVVRDTPYVRVRLMVMPPYLSDLVTVAQGRSVFLEIVFRVVRPNE